MAEGYSADIGRVFSKMRFYYVPKSVFSIYFYKILYNTCIICKKDVLLCKYYFYSCMTDFSINGGSDVDICIGLRKIIRGG